MHFFNGDFWELNKLKDIASMNHKPFLVCMIDPVDPGISPKKSTGGSRDV